MRRGFAIPLKYLLPSWAAKSVEPTGVIGPLGIAKVGRAATENVGSYRRPGGMGQVGAGFDDNGGVCSPGDDEAEAVGSYAQA